MLSNAYFLAKFRFDTAENEPKFRFDTAENDFSFVSLLAMRFATEAAISILRIDDLIKLQPPPEEQR